MSKIDSILIKIKDSLSRGDKLVNLTPVLSRWIKTRLKKGSTFHEIADKLNEANIPTLSGIGQWRADTIEYILNYME